MGAAVGQVPEYIEMVARWCKQYTRMPVIVKLTPNITDIRYPARAALKGGADAEKTGFIKTTDLTRFVRNEMPALSEKIFKQVRYPVVSINGQAFPVGKVK